MADWLNNLLSHHERSNLADVRRNTPGPEEEGKGEVRDGGEGRRCATQQIRGSGKKEVAGVQSVETADEGSARTETWPSAQQGAWDEGRQGKIGCVGH